MIGNDEGSPTVLIVDLEAELLVQVYRCNDFEFRCEMRILSRFEAILLLEVEHVVRSSQREVLRVRVSLRAFGQQLLERCSVPPTADRAVHREGSPVRRSRLLVRLHPVDRCRISLNRKS